MHSCLEFCVYAVRSANHDEPSNLRSIDRWKHAANATNRSKSRHSILFIVRNAGKFRRLWYKLYWRLPFERIHLSFELLKRFSFVEFQNRKYLLITFLISATAWFVKTSFMCNTQIKSFLCREITLLRFVVNWQLCRYVYLLFDKSILIHMYVQSITIISDTGIFRVGYFSCSLCCAIYYLIDNSKI